MQDSLCATEYQVKVKDSDKQADSKLSMSMCLHHLSLLLVSGEFVPTGMPQSDYGDVLVLQSNDKHRRQS